MKEAASDWHLVFEGSGSVTGNGWLEEVCYLGQEQWLLAVRDDPAWSGPDATAQDQMKYSSQDIAKWAIALDGAEAESRDARVRALLKVAMAEKAKECAAALRAHLAGPSSAAHPASSNMAKGWAQLSSIRAAGRRITEAK